MRCVYDNCHEVDSTVHNAKYCKDCKCKRKQENSVKRLATPLRIYDETAWELEEHRKQARAERNKAKDAWILKNKSFAIFDIEATQLDADFGAMLCACIKPVGGKTKTFAIEGVAGDETIVPDIIEELRKYDYIVTWYGTGYDMPFTTTRAIAAGVPTLGYARHVDMYYTSRWKLKLHSNRLASVGDFLFGKTKKDSIVGQIWLRALRGDADALNYIIQPCQKDVVELERVFKELAPHRNLAQTPVRWF